MTPLAESVFDPRHPAISRAIRLGQALELLAQTRRRTLSLATVNLWLDAPIRLGQILFLYSPALQPLAYATWAYMRPETAQAFQADERAWLDTPDWNDGCELWLVDLIAPFGHALPALRQLRATLEGRFDRIRALRRDPDGAVTRIADFRINSGGRHADLRR